MDKKELPVLENWQRDESRNLIYNFKNMYHPNIIFEDDSDYPFKMWFFGWASDNYNPGFSGCDAIFHARSKNLDCWEIYSGDEKWDTQMKPEIWMPVVVPSAENYDNWHNGDPSVVKKDGKYHMAYSAYGFDVDGIASWEEGDTDGDIMCVMGAISDDGIHWTKSAAPLLIWEDEIGKDERILIDKGIHYGNYHRPSIMWDDNKWKMWFDYWAGNDNGISVGYAENTSEFMDIDAWKVLRAGSNPLIAEWPNPDVVKVNSVYYMYGDPAVQAHGADKALVPIQGWAQRQIAEAISQDGINWTVTGWVKPDSDTPANQIPEAFVHDNTIYLWYATQIGGEPYDYRYDKIRYMTRKIE